MAHNESGNKKASAIRVRFVNVKNAITQFKPDLSVLKQEAPSFNAEMVTGQAELLFWEFTLIINID